MSISSNDVMKRQQTATKAEDKVKAAGATTEERLQNVNDRIDQITREAVHYGMMLGLAAMSSRTNADYSLRPVGFADNKQPHEVGDLEQRLLLTLTNA